jgi:hypothetical protein
MSSKRRTLEHWQDLPEMADPLPVMRPVPYKARGSRYGACGIRIDGTPEFIDAVLSRLKPLLAGESGSTRLELSRHPVKNGFKALPNAAQGAECCYIRLHVRGQVTRSLRRRMAVGTLQLPLP